MSFDSETISRSYLVRTHRTQTEAALLTRQLASARDDVQQAEARADQLAQTARTTQDTLARTLTDARGSGDRASALDTQLAAMQVSRRCDEWNPYV